MDQNPVKRNSAKHRLSLWIFCVAGIAACAVFLHIYGQNQSYSISAAAAKLFSKTAIDNGQVSFKNGTLSYNQASQSRDDHAKLTVAGPTNSTSPNPYRVTLASKVSQGISFTGSDSDLPFKLIPLTPTGSGRYMDGRMVYPSDGATNVYTLRRNGIKEDIVLSEAPGASFSYSWKLITGSRLAARLLPDGGVGIYSANPLLYSSNLQVGDTKSQALIDNAKKAGKKDTLIYMIPAPFIKDAKGKLSTQDVYFTLKNDILSLTAGNLLTKDYPLSIDPTVVTTTTAQFRTGYDDGNIDYSTADEIDRGNISLGSAAAFTTSTNRFTGARRDLAAAAYNGYLYIAGGLDNTDATCNGAAATVCSDVQYALINSNGSIGAFTTSANRITGARYFLAAAAYNGYLYITGGAVISGTCNGSGGQECNDVQYALIGAGGSIGAFTTNTNRFAGGRFGLAAAAYNGYFYITGGFDGNDATCGAGASDCSDVQYGLINSDGSIGAFTSSTNHFTSVREQLAAAAYNGYLYITGGVVSSGTCNGAAGLYCNDVQYALINSDGSIGTFTTSTNRFTGARQALAAAATNGYLYITGGFDGIDATCNGAAGTDCTDVQYAPINANGSIGAFTTNTNRFTSARSELAAAAYNGYFYITGGDVASGTCNGASGLDCTDVQYAQINTGTPSFGTVNTFTTNTNRFTGPRHGLAAAAYNGYLYIAGGTVGSGNCNGATGFYCNDVQYAPINSDGSIGTFTTNSNRFTGARFYLAAAAYNGYLYIAGGFDGTDATCNGASGTYCTDVQYAQINSNGSIGTFTTNSNRFTGAREALTAAAYNGYLYIAGGVDGTDATCNGAGGSYCSDVQYGLIGAGGSIGAFTTNTNRFTGAREELAAAAYNGYLYIAGGIDGTDATCNGAVGQFCSDVQYGLIGAGGSIGAFTTNTNRFTGPRYGLATTTYNGYLYVIGGIVTSGTCNGASGTDCTDVQYAQINSNGSIGTFTTNTNRFTGARDGLAAAAYNGYLYIAGGVDGTDATCNGSGATYCTDVQYAQINSPAQAGDYEKIVDTGSNGKITSLSFSGQAVCGLQINYRVGDSSGTFGATTSIYYGLPATTYTVSQAGRYVWVQFMMDDSNCGTRSQITDFTVTYNVAPAAPTLSLPTNAATSVSALPQFQLKTTDADNDYLQYWVDVCSNSSCTGITRSVCQTSAGTGVPGTCTASQTGWSGQDQQGSTAYTGNSVITSSTTAVHNYQVPALSKNTQYWWRAYAIDPGGSNIWSPASSIQTFTTGDDVPAPPTLIYPVSSVNGASVITAFNLRSTENNSDYMRYWIDVCADSGCSSIVRTVCQASTGTNVPSGSCSASQTGWSGQDQQSGTAYSGNPTLSLSALAIYTYQFPDLTPNTTYYWRAYAIDPGGSNTWSSASSIQSFTTAPKETRIKGGVNFKGNVQVY